MITIKYENNSGLLNIGFLPCFIGYYQRNQTEDTCLNYVTDAADRLNEDYRAL